MIDSATFIHDCMVPTVERWQKAQESGSRVAQRMTACCLFEVYLWYRFARSLHLFDGAYDDLVQQVVKPFRFVLDPVSADEKWRKRLFRFTKGAAIELRAKEVELDLKSHFIDCEYEITRLRRGEPVYTGEGEPPERQVRYLLSSLLHASLSLSHDVAARECVMSVHFLDVPAWEVTTRKADLTLDLYVDDPIFRGFLALVRHAATFRQLIQLDNDHWRGDIPIEKLLRESRRIQRWKLTAGSVETESRLEHLKKVTFLVFGKKVSREFAAEFMNATETALAYYAPPRGAAAGAG